MCFSENKKGHVTLNTFVWGITPRLVIAVINKCTKFDVLSFTIGRQEMDQKIYQKCVIRSGEWSFQVIDNVIIQ